MSENHVIIILYGPHIMSHITNSLAFEKKELSSSKKSQLISKAYASDQSSNASICLPSWEQHVLYSLAALLTYPVPC